MKKVFRAKVIILVFAISLLTCGRLDASAIYNYLSDVTIDFNQSWTSYDPVITSIASGAGQYQASTDPALLVDAANRSVYQSAHISGSAGDAALVNGGSSHSYSLFETYVTFVFNVPTNLKITIASEHQTLVNSRDLTLWNPGNQTGELVGFVPGLGGGGTGLQLALDGNFFAPQPSFEPGSSATFSNLTGSHTVLLRTSADGAAVAKYPYVPTPEPSALILLGFGLTGVIGMNLLSAGRKGAFRQPCD